MFEFEFKLDLLERQNFTQFANLEINYQYLSLSLNLSLSWTYQRDRVSFNVNLG